MSSIRIAVPQYNPTLLALAEREPGLARWAPMRGVDTVAALVAGEIDFTGTGATPPLAALAAGADVVHVAASAPRPGHAALLVRDGSPIASVAELRGRTVGLAVGSYHDALLAAALERAGVPAGAVTVVHASGRAGHEAFAAGAIDAWIAADAYLVETERRIPVRRLAETGELLSNRVVWFATRRFVEEEPGALAHLLARADATERWIAAAPRAAAELIGRVLGAGEGAHLRDAWEVALRRRAWGLEPISDAVLVEQQAVADLLHRRGLLPAPVVVAPVLSTSTPR